MDSELRRVVKPDGYRVAWMGGSVTRFVPGMLASRETALSRAKGLLGGMVLESVAGGVCDYVNQSFAGKELWMKTKEEMALWDALAAGQVEVIPIGLWQLEELLKYADLAEVALRTGFHPPDFLFEPADCSLRNCIDAVKEQRDRYLAAVEGGRA